MHIFLNIFNVTYTSTIPKSFSHFEGIILNIFQTIQYSKSIFHTQLKSETDQNTNTAKSETDKHHSLWR